MSVAPPSKYPFPVSTFPSNYGGRPVNTSSFMGLPVGYGAGDITPGYSSPATVLAATSANTTSGPFNPQANSVELYAQFTDGSMTCDISLLSDDGTGTFNVLKTFTGVSNSKANGLTVGEFPDGVSLGGRAIKIQIANIAGSGTVTVKAQRLN